MTCYNGQVSDPTEKWSSNVTTKTTGIIVGGVLKLDERIDLPDNSRVRVAIEPVSDWRARYKAGLKAWNQLCGQHPVHSGGRRFTRNELHERH
jgi:hypothetical protein